MDRLNLNIRRNHGIKLRGSLSLSSSVNMSNEIPPIVGNDVISTPNASNPTIEVQTQSSNIPIIITDEEPVQPSKKRKLTSRAWQHFTKKTVKGDVKAECNHCKKLLGGETRGGTRHLLDHIDNSCLVIRRGNTS
ncbi:hypothetical protein GIB67_008942 [Kingdonia uniflora]|uniref:BED-type domain-containing protein n=1 Tax=Kingdonia uniflora TaxID=39325 RepID=A0A7J7LVI8_9MAGN|nr:hypothetical protein GIB67_008942 [Kingdonia uniflora]